MNPELAKRSKIYMQDMGIINLSNFEVKDRHVKLLPKGMLFSPTNRKHKSYIDSCTPIIVQNLRPSELLFL